MSEERTPAIFEEARIEGREGVSSQSYEETENRKGAQSGTRTGGESREEKPKVKRPRGTGSILRMKGSAVLWIKLADDLIREYRINGRKSIDDLDARWKLHLKPFFGVLRAIEVTR